MVPIPEGTIIMGDKTYEIKNLYMLESEVPWDVFDIYAFKLDVPEADQHSPEVMQSRPSKPYGAPDRGFGHQGYPALSMTYYSAQTFCKWLSAKTGKAYRLPTEAEWQYAAIAGGTGVYQPISEYAWVQGNSQKKTHPIKTKKANGWGLYDMLGNAGEWCTDVKGEQVLCGGTYLMKTVDPKSRMRQDRSWNQTDPQMPKSKWWLSDGTFVGFRFVCEEKLLK